MATWADEVATYQALGATPDQIEQEAIRVRNERLQFGATPEEVDAYFGIKQPDMAPVKALIDENLAAAKPKEGEAAAAPSDPIDSFWESVGAGFGMSSTAMAVKAAMGKTIAPTQMLNENAPMAYRIGMSAGQIAGDLPAIAAASLATTAALPAAGTLALGAAIGATTSALPTAIRESLMEFYEKEDVKDFGEWWGRASGVFLDTLKSGATGALAMGAGGKVAGALAGRGAAATTVGAARVGTEIGVMTSVGSALEGEVPKLQDFTDAAALVTGIHAAVGATGAAAKKLRTIYAKTGIKPSQVLEDAVTNPAIKEKLVNEGTEMPKEYEQYVEPVAPKPEKAPSPVPVEKPVADQKPVLSDAENAILSKIGVKADKKSSYSMDKFYADYVDKLSPFKIVDEMVRGKKSSELDTIDSTYQMARLLSDTRGMAVTFIEQGPRDFKTNKTVAKPLLGILNSVDNVEKFRAYVVAKRALELESRKLKSGFDPEAAAKVVAENSKYEKAANDLVDYSNAALKYLADSGMISRKEYKAMVAAGKNYIPLKRISEEGEALSRAGAKNPVRGYKGSDLAAADPFLSLIENTELYVKAAQHNEFKKSIIKELEDADGKFIENELIEKVAKKQIPVSVSESELSTLFKDLGVEMDAEGIDFTIFRAANKSLAPNEFIVKRNGKTEIYAVKDPLLAEAFKALDGNYEPLSPILKVAKAFTTVKRLGITLATPFQFRNLFKDQISSGVFSKYGTLPFMDVARSFKHLWDKDGVYYDWLSSGAGAGTFLDATTSLDAIIKQFEGKAGKINLSRNLILKPYHAAEALGSMFENATRIAAYKRASGGKFDPASVRRGAFEAREITIDFQRIGAKMQAFNMMTAFSNVGIQGVDRVIRVFKEGTPEQRAQVLGRGLMYIAAPSLLLWWANRDDERVKEIERWEKDINWILATDDWQPLKQGENPSDYPKHLIRENNGLFEVNRGVIYRFPKPEIIGQIFGSMTERTLDAFFTDNPHLYKDFESTIIKSLVPAFTPDVALPVVEQAVNKSFFTDSDLVPHNLAGLLPQERYTEYTSETAKLLGKFITQLTPQMYRDRKGASIDTPIVIDNYIRSWTGTLGVQAVQIADTLLKAAGVAEFKIKPLSTLKDNPFVGSFVVRYPRSKTVSTIDFEEIAKRNSMYIATMKKARERAAFSTSEQFLDKRLADIEKTYQDFPHKFIDFSSTLKAMSRQSAQIQMITAMPNMDPDEKRQQIDSLYHLMIEQARVSLDAYYEMEKEMEAMRRELKTPAPKDALEGAKDLEPAPKIDPLDESDASSQPDQVDTLSE